jgi:hypothetical protein
MTFAQFAGLDRPPTWWLLALGLLWLVSAVVFYRAANLPYLAFSAWACGVNFGRLPDPSERAA